MHKVLRNFLSALILIGWMAPSAGALVVAVHLASDAHHHHPAELAETSAHLEEHLGTLSTLAAAVGGHHHHAEAGPCHEHPVVIDQASSILRPSVEQAASASVTTTRQALPNDRTLPDRRARRASASPLFTAHCALLL